MIEFAYIVLTCATLSAVDGDTIKCNGENMRLLGDGAPFVSGVDTAEFSGNNCKAELMLARLAKRRLEELLKSKEIEIRDSGKRDGTQTDRRLVRIMLPNGKTAGQTLIDERLAIE